MIRFHMLLPARPAFARRGLLLVITAVLIGCGGCKGDPDDGNSLPNYWIAPTILPATKQVQGWGPIWHPDDSNLLYFIGWDSLDTRHGSGLRSVRIGDDSTHFLAPMDWGQGVFKPGTLTVYGVTDGANPDVFSYDIPTNRYQRLTGRGTTFDVYGEYAERLVTFFPDGDSVLYEVGGYEEDGWPLGIYTRDWKEAQPVLLTRSYNAAVVLNHEWIIGAKQWETPNGYGQLLKLNLKTKEEVYITELEKGNVRKDYNDEGFPISNIAISPDQTKIAFNRKSDLWLVNIDGTGLKRLTNIRPYYPGDPRIPDKDRKPGVLGGCISWNKDGSRIAFSVHFYNTASYEEIYVYDLYTNTFLTLR